jgi:hypothetical protein
VTLGTNSTHMCGDGDGVGSNGDGGEKDSLRGRETVLIEYAS